MLYFSILLQLISEGLWKFIGLQKLEAGRGKMEKVNIPRIAPEKSAPRKH
jgi:hypothetical protein